MPTDSTAVLTTGPAATAITSLEALQGRIEAMEQAIARLQANRAQPQLRMDQLVNCGPLSKTGDGQAPIYSKAQGKWIPGSSGGYAAITGTGKTDPSHGTLTILGNQLIISEDVTQIGGTDIELSAGFLFLGGTDVEIASAYLSIDSLPSSPTFSHQVYNNGDGILRIGP